MKMVYFIKKTKIALLGAFMCVVGCSEQKINGFDLYVSKKDGIITFKLLDEEEKYVVKEYIFDKFNEVSDTRIFTYYITKENGVFYEKFNGYERGTYTSNTITFNSGILSKEEVCFKK